MNSCELAKHQSPSNYQIRTFVLTVEGSDCSCLLPPVSNAIQVICYGAVWHDSCQVLQLPPHAATQRWAWQAACMMAQLRQEL